MSYTQLNKIKVAESLVDFINQEVLPGLPIKPADFWQGFESIINNHLPLNRELLKKRDEIQLQIDAWHDQNRYAENDLTVYKKFLTDIEYLLEEGEDFRIKVDHVDREISTIAGPQLVVPINNARFAINAANARWGSLYNALYGTDMIPIEDETSITDSYNKKRGEQVFEFCHQWLDQVLPLIKGSHAQVIDYSLSNQNGTSIEVKLSDNSIDQISNPEQFCGYAQNKDLTLLFIHNELHFELHINRNHRIGQHHNAGIKDIVLEAAITTIQDCEDSVAAVDIEDKLLVYKNWLGLINGNLSCDMSMAGKTVIRHLSPNKRYRNKQGGIFELPGRSLMLVRNTGLHMKTDLVLENDNEMVAEGIIDALVTVLISIHDLKPDHDFTNSHQKSIYIVKPKLHGPQEVAFSCRMFADIEQVYGLPVNTIKIGIMDEERRTTVNLKECIRQASERLIFINTGFLDRTGDEIHSSMQAGPMLPKAGIKNARWMSAYEDWNVDTGLSCGLDGVAQIGKGMWAMPDLMKDMYDTKKSHPLAGASCAWVPSPTAATIHALHYHQIDVRRTQRDIKQRKKADLDFILSIPLLTKSSQLTELEIQRELDNNAQGILGYVVKWIEMGIGCSKVADIHHTVLMEDRATLRISSQHMANWLKHGLCSEQQLEDTFKRMALVVDQQNSTTAGYINMAPDYDGLAFTAALNVVLQGAVAENGYTEKLLHQYRLRMKSDFNNINPG